jgi:methylated-DNA-[protein]-cysteine S-methyltransferase
MHVVCDTAGRLRVLQWQDDEPRFRRMLDRHYGRRGYSLSPASDPFGRSSSIGAYFAGELDAIGDLPVETAGTPFQRAVWGALREIPVGGTMSYGALAARIGRPRAVRAVGLANGANPIGIVVPCHRVIGADGTLTGYGGGLGRKRFLLEHEARHAKHWQQQALVG